MMMKEIKEVKYILTNILLLSVLFIILSITISPIYRQITAQQNITDSSTNNFLTYENTNYGIKIKYPSTWTYVSSLLSEYLIVTFNPPSQQDPSGLLSALVDSLRKGGESSAENGLNSTLERSASLAIWVFPSISQPLNNYVSNKIKELNDSNPDFNIITNQPRNIGGSIPAYELSYTLTLYGQEKAVMAIWTIHDNKAYEFTYLADPASYSSYLPVIENMIDSLEFT